MTYEKIEFLVSCIYFKLYIQTFVNLNREILLFDEIFTKDLPKIFLGTFLFHG